jgi:hypothetical protein
MHCKENSTPYDVYISQLQLSSITLLSGHEAASDGGYKPSLQEEDQAGFRLGSDKVFKCQQALQ